MGLVAMALLVGREPQVAGNSTLVLKIGGDLQEMEPGGVIGQFFEAPPTVRSVVDALRKAKVDRRISSVIIRPTSTAALWGKVQEVRDAIVDFRRSGKPIVGYLEYGGEQEFYLASACDKVFLMPTASLDLTGMASYELFLRGTLDKIGAYPDTLHIGEYKTASNTFTEHTFTPAHREMAESLNADLYEQLIRGLADGRHKSEKEIRALVDHGPFLPEDAVRAGLVDDVAYEDETRRQGAAVAEGSAQLSHRERLPPRDAPTSLGLNRGPRIAVIYASGVIASGESNYDSPSGQVVGSDTMVDYLRKARADSSIKAIVLRVDSPGGSAIASDVIWREVMLTRNVKPVIASMSDVAASGGYYIAMPAHAIVAEPATLTGSIGVVMLKFVIDGTLKKLGMNMEGVHERALRATCIRRCARSRPRSARRSRSRCRRPTTRSSRRPPPGATRRRSGSTRSRRAASGPGAQAKQLGLVDELGGLERALAVAKQRAKLAPDSEVELVVYPGKKSFYDIVPEPVRRVRARDARSACCSASATRAPLQSLTAPLRVFRRGEPLAIMPNVFVR